jgi:hypothetical protein
VLALRNIHGSLIDPNGHLSNWNSDGDPCLSNWTGVVCSNETIEENFLHVVELYGFYLQHIIFVLLTYTNIYLQFGTEKIYILFMPNNNQLKLFFIK